MSTKYVIGSLDTPAFIHLLGKTTKGEWNFVFTPSTEEATRFDTMTTATLELFNLQADSALIRSLALDVQPVTESGLLAANPRPFA